MNAGGKRVRGRRRGRLILVIGGASSGKSATALALAEKGHASAGARAFVATGQPLDDEMAERIRLHRASRRAVWQTYEVPVDLADWFHKEGSDYRVVVLDCLTLWLSNLREQGVPDAEVPGRVAALLQAIRAAPACVAVVTNELGLGLVPAEASARRFRDLAGRVNQQVAAEADQVHLVVSGLSVRIK